MFDFFLVIFWVFSFRMLLNSSKINERLKIEVDIFRGFFLEDFVKFLGMYKKIGL